MFLIDVLRRKRQRQRRGPVRWFALERAGVRTPSVQLLPSGSPLASPSIRSIQRAVTQDSHLGKTVNQRRPGHFLADAGIPARQGCLCGRGCVGTGCGVFSQELSSAGSPYARTPTGRQRSFLCRQGNPCTQHRNPLASRVDRSSPVSVSSGALQKEALL